MEALLLKLDRKPSENGKSIAWDTIDIFFEILVESP